MGLSQQAASIWAKSSGTTEWLPLPQHMLDTLHVAELLYDGWLSRSVHDRWARGPLDPESLRRVVLFLAAGHDCGKAAPVFVAQHEPLAERARGAGLPCPPMAQIREDRRVLPHSLVGQHALYTWLVDRGTNEAVALRLASVVGAHHGRPVPDDELRQPLRRPGAVGPPGSGWPEVRAELLDWLAELTGGR